MKKTSFAAVVALVLAFLLGLAMALPAQAHTGLRRSDPEKNARVASIHRVVLEFAESVQFPVVVVRGADGSRYESGDPVVAGPRVTQAVTDGVPAGRYTIAWRVVSADGHPVEGEIPFTVVGKGPSGGPAAGSPAHRSATAAPAGQPAQSDQGGDAPPAKIPSWLYIVVFGLAGVGIGMFLSLRKKP